MKRNKAGRFTKRKKARKGAKRARRRVVVVRVRAKKTRKRRNITGLTMKKGGTITAVAMDGLKATGGAVAGRIAGKMLSNRMNLQPVVTGGLVFVGGVLLARAFDRALGLGMAAAGGELAAATLLPDAIMGIGDLDPADVDAIERAAMRGVEDVVTGDDVLNGDDDVLNGDDDVLNGDDDGGDY